MIRECKNCGMEYDDSSRKNRPGLIIHCSECADESVEKFTGVMIYTHKTGGTIQVNRDPRITEYIIDATRLRNKGSNLGNNLKVSGPNKTEDACLSTVGSSNAKGKE